MFYLIPIFADKYFSSKETLGKGRKCIRHEVDTVAATRRTRASLARSNMVNTRRWHFSTTKTLSSWFQFKRWHFKVSTNCLQKLKEEKLFLSLLIDTNKLSSWLKAFNLPHLVLFSFFLFVKAKKWTVINSKHNSDMCHAK